MNINADLSDDELSSAMGTETLLAHDLVLGSYPPLARGLRSSRFTGEVLGSRSKPGRPARRDHWRMLRSCQHQMALRGFSLLPSIVTHLLPLSHRVVSIPKLDPVAAGSCEDQEMCAMEQLLLVSGAVS